MHNVIKCS